jgi:PPOX class probable F420-dependent enzyme
VRISVVPTLSPEQVKLLNPPHFATVATVMPDGSPEATVIWIESDSEHVYFNTAMHRLKARNLQRNPHVAVTVFNPDDPYVGVAVRGRAELSTEGANEHIERLARAYTGEGFRGLGPNEVRVIVKITPERIHAFE